MTVLSANFGNYAPTLTNVRLSLYDGSGTIIGSEISSGIASIPNTNGTGFTYEHAPIISTGSFVFYDSTDATKYAIGAIGADEVPDHVLVNTTIATLASQTSFTLTAGSVDDDAYNNSQIIITDQTTGAQKAVGTVSDYTGSTKTVTLVADPGIFTMATGDLVTIIAGVSAASVWAYATRTLTSTSNSASSAADGTGIEIVRGVTYTNTWSGLTIPATWIAVYLTIKSDHENDADTASLVQILESNPSGESDGLLYLNGAAATAAQGSLTVDQGAGTVAGVIDDNATVNLALSTGNGYDLKVLLFDGTSQLLVENGAASIVSTPTRTI